jgi:hypothetical protein
MPALWTKYIATSYPGVTLLQARMTWGPFMVVHDLKTLHPMKLCSWIGGPMRDRPTLKIMYEGLATTTLYSYLGWYGNTRTTTDEGMTHKSSILAYLVFGPGRTSTKGVARPHKHDRLTQPRSRTWRAMQDLKRSSRIRTCLGFIQTDPIYNYLGEQSRDPTFAYKRLGGRSSSP